MEIVWIFEDKWVYSGFCIASVCGGINEVDCGLKLISKWSEEMMFGFWGSLGKRGFEFDLCLFVFGVMGFILGVFIVFILWFCFWGLLKSF